MFPVSSLSLPRHYSQAGVSFSQAVGAPLEGFPGKYIVFITTFQFCRLNWCCIGMGAEYNLGFEIYFISKHWSWLNPSQCREELISLAGLIIYFILTHKKWLSNVLLHLGTAQK